MAFMDPRTDAEREDYKKVLELISAAGIDPSGLSAWDAYQCEGYIDSDAEVFKRSIAGMPYEGEAPSVLPAYATLRVLQAMTEEEKAALRQRLGWKP